MPEEITLAEYRRLAQRKKRKAPAIAAPPSGTRAPAGWGEDYDQAIRHGWSFATDGYLCWAWRGKEETIRVAYQGSYASPPGVYRLAVEECLKRG